MAYHLIGAKPLLNQHSLIVDWVYKKQAHFGFIHFRQWACTAQHKLYTTDTDEDEYIFTS